MCGIAGIVRRTGRPLPNPAVLGRMLTAIGHRGPDDSGEFIGRDLHIGAVRLAIVDPKGGAQPVEGCDHRSMAVCNGTIYNHHAIRREVFDDRHKLNSDCDVAVIPHLFEEFGPSFVELLQGMFSLAVWNEQSGSLLLARDRLGIKPLYYCETPDFLLFASEVKAIFASGLIKPEIDRDSLDDLFSMSYPCPPRTMFRDVRELLPAHQLQVDLRSGRLSIRRYWRCPFLPKGEHRPISRYEAAEELRSKLRSRVYEHLMADVPMGVYLSGGIDSAAIAAHVREVMGDAPTTLSVGFGLEDFDEYPQIAAMAKHIGSENHFSIVDSVEASDLERMIWHLELPPLFPIALPLMRLSALARTRGIPAVLTGEGADELLGGYDAFRADKMRRAFDWPGLGLLRRHAYAGLYHWSGVPDGTVEKMLKNHQSVDAIRSAYGGVFPPWYDIWTTVGVDRDRLLGREGRRVRSVEVAPSELRSLFVDDLAALDPLDAGIAFELATRLPSWILLVGDRSSMANGVEARVPFLDHEIVEYLVSLPPALKMRRFREKSVLRDSVREMLPARVVGQRKRPFFTPIREWFFGPTAPDFVSEHLSRRRLIEADLFDPEFVDELRKRIASAPHGHLSRREIEWTLMLILGAQVLHDQFVARTWSRH